MKKKALTDLIFKAMTQISLHPSKMGLFYRKTEIYEANEYGYFNVFKGMLIIPEKVFLPKEYEYIIENIKPTKRNKRSVSCQY